MRRASPGPRAAQLLAGLLLFLIAPGAPAAALDIAAQQHIRAATFEVVQRKPEESPAVTYDRALPFELIPFKERNDKYRSIGTAFAVGGNRYVTAGHVILAGINSQYGPPALRDAADNVYEIDQIWKFSEHEDFVVFSLKSEPKGVQPLELGPAPTPNDPVFAVGNALGEGIVIRDGLYTSDTPEEQDGEWKWLRFSAAASPGNSGGPLVDQSGRVIGVVLRKSESENLNYALPIERVTALKEGEGKMRERAPVRLPLIDTSETLEVRERIALPKPPPDFFATLMTFTTEQIMNAQRQLLAHNRDRMFPGSASSVQLLHSDIVAEFPKSAHENSDRIWSVTNPKPQSSQLEHNGYVESANGFVKLRLPDDIGLSALYGDSKLFMDLLLKGHEVRRQVGKESVKVTSLGKAQWSSSYTDGYGRIWQLFAWAEPWSDSYLVAVSLPTPHGCVAFLTPILSAFRPVVLETEKLLLDYVYVSYGGTLAQWRDFQNQKNVAPKIFSALKIDIDPERAVHVRSRRFDLDVNTDLLPLSRDSLMWLNFTFFRDGDGVVWDLGGITIGESTQKHNWIEVWRNTEPEAGMPENFQGHWSKLQAREFPFNAKVSSSNGSTRIGAPADPPASAGSSDRVRYALTVVREGDQTQEFMSPKLELLEHSFKALE